jgi:uncharacterized protein (UPF0332 family)
MPYGKLLDEGRIRRHELTAAECSQRIAELLTLADRDLIDAGIAQRPADGRHNSAYEAARAAADAMLVAEGYRRAGGEGQHAVLFDFLALVGSGEFAVEASYFQKARRLRNKTHYDKAGIVSEASAAGTLRNARMLVDTVRQWLRDAHPDLA